MLTKFTGFEEPCLLIHEFDEVCLLIHMPRVSNDVVSMKFIPFALKYDFKRWMRVLKVGSINS